jgi:hypothetical protein
MAIVVGAACGTVARLAVAAIAGIAPIAAPTAK